MRRVHELLWCCVALGPFLGPLSAPLHSQPYEVPAAASEIAIDGSVTEVAWDKALRLELGYEVRPGENIAPPVETEVLVTYDSRRAFFAFRCKDPEPGRIRARYRNRACQISVSQ